jgi:hypothetical protein
MCNLYSITPNQEAICRLARVMVDNSGNLPPPLLSSLPDLAAAKNQHEAALQPQPSVAQGYGAGVSFPTFDVDEFAFPSAVAYWFGAINNELAYGGRVGLVIYRHNFPAQISAAVVKIHGCVGSWSRKFPKIGRFRSHTHRHRKEEDSDRASLINHQAPPLPCRAILPGGARLA